MNELRKAIEAIVHVQFPGAVVKAPLPVWDTTGQVGASITVDKMMGKTPCEQTVSFVLDNTHIENTAFVQQRAILAINVLRVGMLSGIRRKRDVKTVVEVEGAAADVA